MYQCMLVILYQRGIGQYFDIFFLAELHLSCKMQLLICKYKKKRKMQKFLLQMKKSSFLLNTHKVGMRLICIHDAV